MEIKNKGIRMEEGHVLATNYTFVMSSSHPANVQGRDLSRHLFAFRQEHARRDGGHGRVGSQV